MARCTRANRLCRRINYTSMNIDSDVHRLGSWSTNRDLEHTSSRLSASCPPSSPSHQDRDKSTAGWGRIKIARRDDPYPATSQTREFIDRSLRENGCHFDPLGSRIGSARASPEVRFVYWDSRLHRRLASSHFPALQQTKRTVGKPEDFSWPSSTWSSAQVRFLGLRFSFRPACVVVFKLFPTSFPTVVYLISFDTKVLLHGQVGRSPTIPSTCVVEARTIWSFCGIARFKRRLSEFCATTSVAQKRVKVQPLIASHCATLPGPGSSAASPAQGRVGGSFNWDL